MQLRFLFCDCLVSKTLTFYSKATFHRSNVKRRLPPWNAQ